MNLSWARQCKIEASRARDPRIDSLNRASEIDGILVQLPLPGHFNPQEITRAIDPAKDVDGFHPQNIGKLLLGEEGGFIPCTPHGIQLLLERSKIEVGGKHVVIVGRSNIVGKPLAALLIQKRKDCNATVTIAHSQSEHLSDITRSNECHFYFAYWHYSILQLFDRFIFSYSRFFMLSVYIHIHSIIDEHCQREMFRKDELIRLFLDVWLDLEIGRDFHRLLCKMVLPNGEYA